MAYSTNTFGLGTKLFSILDGDVKNNAKIKKIIKNYKKCFYQLTVLRNISIMYVQIQRTKHQKKD